VIAKEAQEKLKPVARLQPLAFAHSRRAGRVRTGSRAPLTPLNAMRPKLAECFLALDCIPSLDIVESFGDQAVDFLGRMLLAEVARNYVMIDGLIQKLIRIRRPAGFHVRGDEILQFGFKGYVHNRPCHAGLQPRFYSYRKGKKVTDTNFAGLRETSGLVGEI